MRRPAPARLLALSAALAAAVALGGCAATGGSTEPASAQGPEIAQLEAWLEAWGADTSAMADHGDHGMAGMQSEEDLQAIRDAEAGDAQVLFLEATIEHHEGALDMAEAHLEEGADPDALALSEQVIATQQAEIDEMRTLLDELA